MNICVSSAGRRVGLMACFRRTLQSLGLEGRLIAADLSRTTPAVRVADCSHQVPRCTTPEFVPRMLEICQRERVDLIVPTIDTELLVYAESAGRFAEIGTRVSISSPAAIRIAADKVSTHTWLVREGFPTVRQAAAADVLVDPGRWSFPVIAKPRSGSASVGVQRLWSIEALGSACEERGASGGEQDLIVQEVAPGQEHTVNVLADAEGHCLCAVPHKRLEVRAGEVSKGVTVKDESLIGLAGKIVERLPGAYGPLNIQAFVAPDGGLRVIEINPRFGGGYPLAYEAGADFPRWLIEHILNRPTTASFDDWQENLVMLRYDEAVYVPAAGVGLG